VYFDPFQYVNVSVVVNVSKKVHNLLLLLLQVREALDRVARLQDELEEERRRLPGVAEENSALQEERDRLQREVERQTEMQVQKRAIVLLQSCFISYVDYKKR